MKPAFTRFSVLAVAAGLFSALTLSVPAAAPVVWPGQQPDGSMLLPNQWSLRPVGTQIELGDFPVNVALTPDGKYAAVLHCGYSQHEVLIVDLTAQKVVDHANLGEAFYGITFSHDGRELFCGGGEHRSSLCFPF